MPERHTRRRFIGRAATLTTMAGVLQACGIEGTAQKNFSELQELARSVNHPKVPIGDWTFSNWPLYIDKKVLKDFDAEYGGKVKYVEEINEDEVIFRNYEGQRFVYKQPRLPAVAALGAGDAIAAASDVVSIQTGKKAAPRKKTVARKRKTGT